jgi:hypothetical protein
VSTQQILHPALYRSGKASAPVALPAMDKALGSDWAKLEDNTMGEFGWREVLKQFLGEEKAEHLSPAWDGDRYLVYERKQTKNLVLVTRVRLATEEQAKSFFGQYSEALEKKHQKRTDESRQSALLSFETPEGGVFLRCVVRECVTLEGADRTVFNKLNKELDWDAVPEPTKQAAEPPESFPMAN